MESGEEQSERTSQLIENWYRKRKWLVTVGLLHQFVLYFDYTAVSISALYYFKNDFRDTSLDANKMYVVLRRG